VITSGLCAPMRAFAISSTSAHVNRKHQSRQDCFYLLSLTSGVSLPDPGNALATIGLRNSSSKNSLSTFYESWLENTPDVQF